MLIEQIFTDPISVLITLTIIIISLSVHEAAHAYSAYWFGDITPKLQERLTLNPMAHVDPFGLLFIVLAGIGWGRPVQFNPYNLKNPRRDGAIIAVAGPLSNILLAFLGVVLYIVLSTLGLIDISVVQILRQFIFLNIALAVFNMIPLEPLDGFKVVAGLLPGHLALQWHETARYGIYVLLILLITGGIERIIFPVSGFILKLLLLPFSF